MARHRFLDRGTELMLIYPQVTVLNRRGEPMQVPSDKPVEVWVHTTYDRPQTAELPGQVHVELIKCFAREAPVGPWARIVYQDQEWDIARPPRFTPGTTKALRHVEWVIRSRNDVDRSGS